MRLEAFVKQKREAWYRLSELTERYERSSGLDESELSELIRLYRAACADYAHARTAYPYDRIVSELNQRIGQAHQAIYGSRQHHGRLVLDFYTKRFPAVFHRHWKTALFATLVFITGALLSFGGCFLQPELPRTFLGDRYVYFTKQKINENDPFAIYAQEDSPAMSGFIMTNNIKVTIFAFGMGIFLGVGTIYVLFYNGLMLGTFFYLFFTHGLLGRSLLTIMMHGTLELSAIFIAGTAGLLIGRALLFPGSYSRKESLRILGADAMILMLGCIPLLILAGLIEGFITRLPLEPAIQALFLVANVAFLIWYLRPPSR